LAHVLELGSDRCDLQLEVLEDFVFHLDLQLALLFEGLHQLRFLQRRLQKSLLLFLLRFLLLLQGLLLRVKAKSKIRNKV